nr:hypothetical protein Iba_chr11dCG5840 [Ipomoea batatas]GME05016.1 hypothetical protein Iba_scaffold2431CG0360 [Ipomoea batatas]GME08812.1 hypothetical protein Iba_scaffold8000.4CG0890 [Ipomoea batatas]GME11011.1 hypothetical protein Iba_scaffold11308.1CG0130 [Ipomoea batatas]
MESFRYLVKLASLQIFCRGRAPPPPACLWSAIYGSTGDLPGDLPYGMVLREAVKRGRSLSSYHRSGRWQEASSA